MKISFVEEFGLSVSSPLARLRGSRMLTLALALRNAHAMAARSCYHHHHRRRRYALASLTSLVFAEGNHYAVLGQRRTFRTVTAFAYNPSPHASSPRAAPVRLAHSVALCSTSIPTPATHFTASAEIEMLTKHNALWDESEPLSKARRKLQRRHRALFQPTDDADRSDSTSSLALFNEFCTVLCDTGVMPRKEIFETWSAALHIHETFGRQVRRVCDVAAGHSLLAWALLVLDDNAHNKNDAKPLTVLCVDRRMPPSAETIRLAMIEKWPHLEDRFDFVEGSLEQMQPHPSCLLASVHACGGLSDILIASAASSQSPIALVPCCHTRKKKALLGASDFARKEYDAIIQSKEVRDLTTMLDEAREAALRNAGFDIRTQYLPKRFTLKNRIVMGMPRSGDVFRTSSSSDASIPPGRMPPIEIDMSLAKANFLSRFTIPCEDSDDARLAIKELSGKANADRRKKSLHRKGNAETPTYDISIWLPPDGVEKKTQHEWEEALSKFASSMRMNIKCEAKQIGDEFVNSAGRRARAFRLSYQYENGGKEEDGELTNKEAKAIHREVYATLPTKYPGAECR